jgi:hypothetical protein
VREYVRARKRELGWAVGEVFVPQVHAPGMEGEVDWGEADVVQAGVLTTVHLFVRRASVSGAAFCQASLVETQQAFLELHVQAFEWYGGVFTTLRFEQVQHVRGSCNPLKRPREVSVMRAALSNDEGRRLRAEHPMSRGMSDAASIVCEQMRQARSDAFGGGVTTRRRP